jgi:hypothetical protein
VKTSFIRLEKCTGPATTVGNTIVSPQAVVLKVRWPFGGAVWNYPIALRVEQNGQVRQIPVLDVTRLVEIAMLFTAALVVLIASSIVKKNKEKSR